jgi:hypothetical protein
MTPETPGPHPPSADDPTPRRLGPEKEAHLPSRPEESAGHDPNEPAEVEGHASLRLVFAPESPEHTIEVRYRPSAAPGEPPEVELHAFSRWSDKRLKRVIRPL